MSGITQEEIKVADRAEKDGTAILARAEQSDGTPKEDISVYLEGWALRSLALAIMSSGFMLSLDDTILGTDLPVRKITRPV